MSDPDVVDRIKRVDEASKGVGQGAGELDEAEQNVTAVSPDSQLLELSSVWVVTSSRQSNEDYRDWNDEESWQTIERGYFLTEELARDWIVRAEQAAFEAEKTAYEESREQQLRMHELSEDIREHKVKQRQTEYDTLKAAGVVPSFARPGDFAKKRFTIDEFDEQKYRRSIDIRYEVEELKPHADVPEV